MIASLIRSFLHHFRKFSVLSRAKKLLFFASGQHLKSNGGIFVCNRPIATTATIVNRSTKHNTMCRKDLDNLFYLDNVPMFNLTFILSFIFH